MSETTLKEKEWVLVKYAQTIVRPLGVAIVLLALMSIVGYLGSVEILYRPITNGPATHPLSAMSILFMGLGIVISNNKKQGKWLLRVFSFLVIIIASVRFFDIISNSNVSSFFTPFYDHVTYDLQSGKSNAMGLNSAMMFFGISISLMLYSFQKFVTAQFVAFIIIALPIISFTGYIYGLENFYGEMSVLTTTEGFILSVATLAMTANIGSLKAILSPYVGGKIARIQTFAGLAFPTILGYPLIKTMSSSDGNFFGLFVVTICWFIVIMVGISANFQEKIDYERRKGEYLLEKSAESDPLTGLANRRKFLKFGEDEISRIQRNKSQLWLLILDIDNFKKINDTAGHDMGDQVLVELSKVLQSSVRNIDLVSRIGGEEFSIILLDTMKHGAALVAENIRMNIEKISIEGWTDIHGPVTASIGCASSDGDCTLEETFKFADNALYQAKENGRNQVIFADDSECCS